MEPKLVYRFVLAFGMSHEKWEYLFPQKGGESELTESRSVAQHSAFGSLLLNKYLLIQKPFSQRSLSTKKGLLRQSVRGPPLWDCPPVGNFAHEELNQGVENWLGLYNLLIARYGIQVKLKCREPAWAQTSSFSQDLQVACRWVSLFTPRKHHWALAREESQFQHSHQWQGWGHGGGRAPGTEWCKFVYLMTGVWGEAESCRKAPPEDRESRVNDYSEAAVKDKTPERGVGVEGTTSRTLVKLKMRWREDSGLQEIPRGRLCVPFVKNRSLEWLTSDKPREEDSEIFGSICYQMKETGLQREGDGKSRQFWGGELHNIYIDDFNWLQYVTEGIYSSRCEGWD